MGRGTKEGRMVEMVVAEWCSPWIVDSAPRPVANWESCCQLVEEQGEMSGRTAYLEKLSIFLPIAERNGYFSCLGPG